MIDRTTEAVGTIRLLCAILIFLDYLIVDKESPTKSLRFPHFSRTDMAHTVADYKEQITRVVRLYQLKARIRLFDPRKTPSETSKLPCARLRRISRQRRSALESSS